MSRACRRASRRLESRVGTACPARDSPSVRGDRLDSSATPPHRRRAVRRPAGRSRRRRRVSNRHRAPGRRRGRPRSGAGGTRFGSADRLQLACPGAISTRAGGSPSSQEIFRQARRSWPSLQSSRRPSRGRARRRDIHWSAIRWSSWLGSAARSPRASAVSFTVVIRHADGSDPEAGAPSPSQLLARISSGSKPRPRATTSRSSPSCSSAAGRRSSTRATIAVLSSSSSIPA